MNATLGVLVVGAALFGSGVAVGVLVTWAIVSRSLGMVSLFRRTGNLTAPDRGATKSDGPGPRVSHGGTIEMRAAQEARERVIERGTARFMELQPELTKAEARERAEEALKMMGAFDPTGGIPSS